jgi:hypothetical protein
MDAPFFLIKALWHLETKESSIGANLSWMLMMLLVLFLIKHTHIYQWLHIRGYIDWGLLAQRTFLKLPRYNRRVNTMTQRGLLM